MHTQHMTTAALISAYRHAQPGRDRALLRLTILHRARHNDMQAIAFARGLWYN